MEGATAAHVDRTLLISRTLQLFLLSDEPLRMPPDSPAIPPVAPIKSARQRYINTMLATMRAPDGSYEEGFAVPGMNVSSLRAERTAADLEKNNPLSLDDEVWGGWYS